MSKQARHQRLIVNADDFGMSSSVNKAILSAFDHGLISRASIMANMPGFNEACDLVREFHLEGRIGVHLNITEGRPMTEQIPKCARFCDEAGSFRSRHSVFSLSSDESRVVEEEFQTQVQACIDRRILPTHLDSHHHYHTEWGIGTVVIRVARKNGIRAVRLSRNCGPGISAVKRLYKTIYNQRLGLHGLARMRYFGSVRDVRTILGTARGDVEIMVHPRLSACGMVTDMEDGEDLQTLLDKLGFSIHWVPTRATQLD